MLLRELIFKDFLVFKGENRITFPPPNENDSSLLLVLAPNSGGKTSVIRGLEFLLYGRLRRDMPATFDGLINKAYVKSTPKNTTLEAWVQAKIEIAGETRTIRRRIETARTGSGARPRVVLEETAHARRGDIFKEDEGSIQRSLERLVPESLFDYFYFQGETLAQQLVQGGGNQAIREGLATLLHEDKWEAAIETLEQVRRKLSNEIQNLAAANKEYKKKDSDREQVKEWIRKAQTDIKTWQEKETQAQADFDAAEEQIKALGTGQAHHAITAELNRKRADAKATAVKFAQLDAKIATLVAESKGLPFYRSAFEPALKLLGQMKDENLLPADVSDGFVSRLLGGTRCICGRPLTPEDEFSEERSCIEEYRKRTLAVDLNSGLLSLLNQLDSKTRQNLHGRIDALRTECQALVSDRGDTIVDQNDLDQAIKDLEAKRAKSNIDAIVHQQAKQRDAAERRNLAVGKQKELEMQIKNLEFKDKQLKHELDDMGRRGAGPHILKLNATRERANELQVLIEESLSRLKSSFHTLLQRSVGKYYDPKANDNSQAFIDPKTLLPSIRRNGEVLHALGGGQRQMLVLAHIISLAELRRGLHAQLDALGIKTGRLDDQSFFLDSIFAPCDPAYARDVAAFLPGKARQMILLVARQQWYKEIQSEIEPHVQKVFLMRLHSNNQDRPAEEYVFLFKGRRLNLFTRIPVDEEPYSSIEEVK
jgi:DNA sulfur modification protein DndD